MVAVVNSPRTRRSTGSEDKAGPKDSGGGERNEERDGLRRDKTRRVFPRFEQHQITHMHSRICAIFNESLTIVSNERLEFAFGVTGYDYWKVTDTDMDLEES